MVAKDLEDQRLSKDSFASVTTKVFNGLRVHVLVNPGPATWVMRHDSEYALDRLCREEPNAKSAQGRQEKRMHSVSRLILSYRRFFWMVSGHPLDVVA
jgi:hypothetical protein